MEKKDFVKDGEVTDKSVEEIDVPGTARRDPRQAKRVRRQCEPQPTRRQTAVKEFGSGNLGGLLSG